MMTATNELRRMLTDAGVKYFGVDECTTYWDGILDGTKCGIWRAFEFDGLLHITFSDDGDFVTPQEAIAATVGNAALEAENAKLRELVRSAVRCITDVPDCDSCVLGEQVSGVWVCHLIGAAKELGVEVGDA